MGKKVALVTGASSGIGFESAIWLKKAGFTVYGAARRLEKMESLKEQGVIPLPLDVTEDASMVRCIETIVENEGKIDVLVNNAGYGAYGALEDVPISEARKQMEVNVFGLARMAQLVLPHMRRHGFGRIINISSMGGKIYTSFGGWYHAAKFAVEALSDCLRLEIEGFGIDVVVIEPGGIRTDWGLIAAENLKRTSRGGAYEKSSVKVADAMRKVYRGGKVSDPSVVAKAVVAAATAKRPKIRYLLGFGAKPSVFLRWILPDRIFDRVVGWIFGGFF
ncbi:oxidoreductase [Anaerotalea alkaliphila]|uniref:SDR family NAD(P)-dependent oxidoreductase n=1 Tax=Anaerotalea alkaliphila TaxID=2662126 RepID=A0A7X5HXT2_9FIRM|nr:oxidoreductase [Anaerotalea alkaliphila]NDL68571.1 SDR family NAD(P)-dependent oxidoreductase [Anaerotalea alkaliphila]